MSKRIIISGCTGQAGSLMADYLIANTDLEIYGMVRRLSVSNHKNIEHLKSNPRFHLITGDLTDGHSLYECINQVKPDYFINAAAQSFVAESWNSPVNTFETDAVAVIHILEAIRKLVPKCRFINFASSEMFGDVVYSPQDINHPFRSRSPYAAAKVAAHQIVKVYRESYNLYACSAICYNYEGRRRGTEFVTRKISKGVARIYHAVQNGNPFEPIHCGNVDAKRDWSDAEDIVDGIWRMLNQEDYNMDIRYDLTLEVVNKWKFLTQNIKEYVLASGETHSIREFIEEAFRVAGLIGEWHRFEDGPTGILYADYIRFPKEPFVIIDPAFFRPAEVDNLCGNSAPIRKELGWAPQSNFYTLVKKMVQHDIEEEAG